MVQQEQAGTSVTISTTDSSIQTLAKKGDSMHGQIAVIFDGTTIAALVVLVALLWAGVLLVQRGVNRL